MTLKLTMFGPRPRLRLPAFQELKASMMHRQFKTQAAALGALGCSLALALTAHAMEPAPSAARGRLQFLRCASCHDISSTPSAKIGPNLKGVYGRKAGSLAGYSYSPAMKAADFTWDEAHLDRWLTQPTSLVPGTAMAFAGVPSAADRAAIIAYLRDPPK
jgi:cytochrome c